MGETVQVKRDQSDVSGMCKHMDLYGSQREKTNVKYFFETAREIFNKMNLLLVDIKDLSLISFAMIMVFQL